MPINLFFAFTFIKGVWVEWRRKRIWNADRQVRNLRNIMLQDQRWLGHNPVANSLTARYLELLSDRWEEKSIQPIGDLRFELNLVPTLEAVQEDPDPRLEVKEEAVAMAKDDEVPVGRAAKVPSDPASHRPRKTAVKKTPVAATPVKKTTTRRKKVDDGGKTA